MRFARTNSCSRPLTFRWPGLADGKGCVRKAARTVGRPTETGDRIPERGEGGGGDGPANELDGPVRQGPQCALPSPPRATVSTALLRSYAGPGGRDDSALRKPPRERRDPRVGAQIAPPSNLPGPLPPGWNVAAALRASGSHRPCGRAGDDGRIGDREQGKAARARLYRSLTMALRAFHKEGQKVVKDRVNRWGCVSKGGPSLRVKTGREGWPPGDLATTSEHRDGRFEVCREA
jgi:hypothetical protein